MISFTIATVCFNAQATIERTLRSVAQQDHPHVQHLVVDGASTDATLDIIHRHQATLRQTNSTTELNLISEPDSGLYDAMNKALRRATGTYLLFLNAGDTLHHSTTLSQLAQAAQAQSTLPAVLYGDTNIVDTEGNFLRKRHLAPPPQLTAQSFRSGMLVCHQAFLPLTTLAQSHPYDLRYRFSADYDWCVRILRSAENSAAATLNAHIVIADYLSEGITTANHRASLLERFRIMARHYGPLRTTLAHIGFIFRAIAPRR